MDDIKNGCEIFSHTHFFSYIEPLAQLYCATHSYIFANAKVILFSNENSYGFIYIFNPQLFVKYIALGDEFLL